MRVVTGTFLFVEMASLVLLTAWVSSTLGGAVGHRDPTGRGSGHQSARPDSASALLVLVITAAVLAQYGYGCSVYFVEETKDPRRSLVRAVLLSAVITVVVEVIPLVAILFGSDSLTDVLGSDLPVEHFLEQRAGNARSSPYFRREDRGGGGRRSLRPVRDDGAT